MSRQPRKRSSARATAAGGSRRAEAKPDALAQQRQLALDAAHMGWWHYDPVTLVATYDKRYTEIFGFSGCERPNEEILKLLHPEDRAHVWATVEAALDPANPKPYSAEYRVNRPDGKMVWVEAHGLATFEGRGRARRATSLVGTVADITGRKQAEAALRGSHDRTSAILAGIADAFYSLDDQWRLVMVNPAAERAPFGRPASELVGKVIWDVFPKLVGTRIHQHYLDAVEKRSHEHYEARSPLNGRWYEVFMFPRTGGLDVYLRDIDDRKQVEEALRGSEERFRRLASNAQDSIVRLDRSARYVYVNPFVTRLLGLPEEAILGKTPEEIGRNIGVEHFETRLKQVFESGQPLRFDRRSVEGRWYDVQLVPEFRGTEVETVLSFSRDITERREAEAALRASEERLKLAQQIAHLGSWDLDLIENRLSWSDEVYRIFGFRSQEFGATYEAFLAAVHPEDRAAVDGAYSGSLRDGRDSYEIEHRIIRPSSGEIRTVHEKCEHVRDKSGRIVRSVGMVQDITERKAAEAAIEAANRQLREQDLHKNEFLAILSHELRNPLAPIRNSLYILDHAPSGGKQSQHARAVIGRQVDQLARLVDDLLDVTRVSRNKIQLQRHSLELNDLVHRTVEDHRSLFEEKAITVEATLAADPLPVNGDADRLAQVLGNLLQNAAKFTPAGGRVTVSTAVAPSKTRAILRVSDTGAGIEPSLLRRLFQPFMQAEATLDRSKGGLGLGLALVKGLVEMHGGEVRAHSEGPGKGAEFAVELPLDETADTEPSASPAGPERSGRRVLVIEDNHDAADSLREVLEFGAHVVEVAYNGPDGLDRARIFKPEIVLCDIGLPGMDGYEVARAFRADPALKDMFLVALSGYALPDDLQRARAAGFEEHLAKPSSLEKLEELLAHAPATDRT
ncbi:MAG: PAS domain S-box protein [Polyangia bacterium]